MRSGGGPRFVEIETYRFCGHVGPENDDWLDIARPTRLRPGAAATRCRRCAKRRCRSECPSRLRQWEAEIEDEIGEALAAARPDPFPDFRWSLDQVWSRSYSPIVKEFVRGGEAAFDSHQAETRLKPY